MWISFSNANLFLKCGFVFQMWIVLFDLLELLDVDYHSKIRQGTGRAAARLVFF